MGSVESEQMAQRHPAVFFNTRLKSCKNEFAEKITCPIGDFEHSRVYHHTFYSNSFPFNTLLVGKRKEKQLQEEDMEEEDGSTIIAYLYCYLKSFFFCGTGFLLCRF